MKIIQFAFDFEYLIVVFTKCHSNCTHDLIQMMLLINSKGNQTLQKML